MGRMVNGGARLLSNVGLKTMGTRGTLRHPSPFPLTLSLFFPPPSQLCLTHLLSLFPILSPFRIKKKKIRYSPSFGQRKLDLSRSSPLFDAGQTSLFLLPYSIHLSRIE